MRYRGSPGRKNPGSLFQEEPENRSPIEFRGSPGVLGEVRPNLRVPGRESGDSAKPPGETILVDVCIELV